MIAAAIVLVSLLLYLFLIAASRRKPDASALLYRLYAHRGLYDPAAGIPENSMRAFSEAVQHGYGIELDVQLTADGRLVVHHDANLKRVCGADVEIAQTDYDTLCHHPLPDGSTVPLFSDVLKLIAGRVPLIVEIKHGGSPEENARAAWEQLKDYQGPYCIESFHPLCVRYFKRNAPHVLRGQLAMGTREPSISRPLNAAMHCLLMNAVSRPHFIAYQSAYDRNPSVFLMKHLFKPYLAAWTVRSPQEMTDAIRKGYAMPIFEGFLPDSGIFKEGGCNGTYSDHGL